MRETEGVCPHNQRFSYRKARAAPGAASGRRGPTPVGPHGCLCLSSRSPLKKAAASLARRRKDCRLPSVCASRWAAAGYPKERQKRPLPFFLFRVRDKPNIQQREAVEGLQAAMMKASSKRASCRVAPPPIGLYTNEPLETGDAWACISCPPPGEKNEGRSL